MYEDIYLLVTAGFRAVAIEGRVSVAGKHAIATQGKKAMHTPSICLESGRIRAIQAAVRSNVIAAHIFEKSTQCLYRLRDGLLMHMLGRVQTLLTKAVKNNLYKTPTARC